MESRRAQFFELASVTACEAITRKDAELLKEPDSFVAANSFAYYLGINTWLIQISHYCGPVYQQVFTTICRDGLRATVMRFDACSAAIIAGEPVDDDLVADICDSVVLYPRDVRYLPPDVLATPTAVKLQLCRYLKRLNLLEDTTLAEQALIDFNVRQTSLYTFWNQPNPSRASAVRLVTDVLDELNWDPVLQVLREAREKPVMAFTHGAARETGRNKQNKLRYLAQICPEYYRPIFGDMSLGMPERVFLDKFVDAHEFFPWRGYGLQREHTVSLTTAPKAVKGPRLIAVEPLYYQMKTKWMQSRLYRLCPVGMDLSDQTVNQRLARKGSEDGSMATIDLSAASDYVTKALVAAVFPEAVAAELAYWAPLQYLAFPGRQYSLTLPLYSYATMGHGLTFWVESLVFWAIAKAACRDIGVSDQVSVYGDDIVVPTLAYDRTCELLGQLGFSVNGTKSYGSGSYRESCGVEALSGVDLFAVYFPRMPVRGEITEHTCTMSSDVDWDGRSESYFDCTSRLVSLQHRLYRYSVAAAEFLAAVIADAHPGITWSRWGDEYAPDLWGAESRPHVVPGLYSLGRISFLKKGPTQRASQYSPSKAGWCDAVRALCWQGYPSATVYRGIEQWKAPLDFESGHTREMRYAGRISYVGQVDPMAKALAERDAYWHFLEHGPEPLYPDDTVDCAGGFLSAKPVFRDQLKTPVVKFGYTPV